MKEPKLTPYAIAGSQKTNFVALRDEEGNFYHPDCNQTICKQITKYDAFWDQKVYCIHQEEQSLTERTAMSLTLMAELVTCYHYRSLKCLAAYFATFIGFFAHTATKTEYLSLPELNEYLFSDTKHNQTCLANMIGDIDGDYYTQVDG